MTKKLLFFGLTIAACLLLTGCLVMPFPHREWVAPAVRGRVIDGQSRQAVANVLVTRVHPELKPVSVTTDEEGRFEMPGQEKVRWFYLDRFAKAPLRFEHPTYQILERSFYSGWADLKALQHYAGEIELKHK